MELIVELTLLCMSEKYKFRNPDGIYFVTTTVVDWIDLFTRKNYCELIVDSLEYCRKHKGLAIYAWCIMPSHIHFIVARNGEESLSDIFRDFKKFTSKSIIKEINLINESRRGWLIDAFISNGKKLNPEYAIENLLRLKTASKSDINCLLAFNHSGDYAF